MLGSSCLEVFCKKVTLKSFAKLTATPVPESFLRTLQDTCDKETPEHVFSCEFSEIFRGNFFAGHLRMATTEYSLFHDFSEKITF